MINVFIALGIATLISLIFIVGICIVMILHDKQEEYRLGLKKKKSKKSKKSKKVNKR